MGTKDLSLKTMPRLSFLVVALAATFASAQDAPAQEASAQDAPAQEISFPVVSVPVDGFGNLDLFAGDKVDNVVDAFIAKHSIPAEDRAKIIEAVVQKIRALAPQPVAQVAVMLPAVFNIYNPQNLENETLAFCHNSGIRDSASCQKVYDAAVRKLTGPVITFPFELTAGSPPVNLDLYEGDDVKNAVLAFAQKHNLNQEGANQVYAVVAEKLQSANATAESANTTAETPAEPPTESPDQI